MTEKERIRQQLSGYLDGELSEANRREVQRAVEADAELAKELRQLQKVRELVGRLPREQASEDFVSNVLAQAERRDLIGPTAETRAPRSTLWVRWLASAAVLLIAVGIVSVIAVVLSKPASPERLAEADRREPVGRLARDVNEFAETRVPPPGERIAIRGKEGLAGAELAKTVAAKERPLAKHARRSGDLAKTEAKVEAAPVTALARKPAAKAGPTADRTGRAVTVQRSVPTLAEAPAVGGKVTEPAPSDERELNKQPALAKGQAPPAKRAAPPMLTKKAESSREDVPIAAKLRQTPRTLSQEESGWGVAQRGRASESEIRDIDKEFAAARNEIVFTDDLPATQRQVEKLLQDNSIVPLVVESPAEPDEARIRRQRVALIANYMQLAQRSPEQVEYLAYVTPSQMQNVASELKKIRVRQRVSQIFVTVEGQFMAPKGKPASLPAATKPATTEKPWIAVVETHDGELHLKDEVDEKQVVPEQRRRRLRTDVQPLLITLNYRTFDRADAAQRSAPESSRQGAVPVEPPSKPETDAAK